ncbi:MAG TPA: polyprenyl synthetase family protein [Caulifigura sp.]|nr:polyprenyl synthetase family protein [Caulifigura sp.]
MSLSASVDELPVPSEAAESPVGTAPKPSSPRDKSGRSTSHLKIVPETLEQREFIKREAEKYAQKLDKSRAFTKSQLEQHGRTLLKELDQPEKYLGFSMVMIGNFFWKKQFLALPFNRRMLLLPHCLKHADGCPADYDEFGLDCEKCGACSIADYKVRAEQLGYKVLVAEGSPVVLKIIVSGHIDGILGVACLNVLEKAIDKILLAGVPSYAVPLHSGDCKSTTLDEAWVWECLDKYEPLDGPQTASYVPMMRRIQTVFEKEFDFVVPGAQEVAKAAAGSSPLNFTAAVAHDWLQHGGKRLRPFVTLAAYDALTGGKAVDCRSEADLPAYGPEILRVAMAIEAFHKASLVHDDIEDGDEFRYGRRTIHNEHSLGAAINVGDYLIGLGYRLVSANRGLLPPDVIADILDCLAQAHVKLCEGQGAELQWTTSGELLSPLDAMKIYALKTSPAFEAALYAGLRLAGPIDQYETMLTQFCRHVGVGFQILNDLQDWQEHESNKKHKGRDAETAKPTLLAALAAAAATPAQRATLDEIMSQATMPALRIDRLRSLYHELGVFDQAKALVEKCRARAEALADETQPDSLRQLLYFLTDTILAQDSTEPAIAPPLVPLSLTPVSA